MERIVHVCNGDMTADTLSLADLPGDIRVWADALDVGPVLPVGDDEHYRVRGEFWAARERPVMEAIVNQLAQVGIKATLRYVKGPTLTKARKENQVVMYYGSSGSFSVPDAGAVMGDKFQPHSSENYTGNAQVGASVAAALTSYEPKARLESFRKAIELIAENAYWAPVYHYSEEYLVSKEAHFDAPRDGMQRLYLIRWR